MFDSDLPFALDTNQLVTLDSSDELRLAEILNSAVGALVFLRHFGCVFCREQLTELGKTDSPITFVGRGTPDDARKLRGEIGFIRPMICDIQGRLFEEAGCAQGKLSQLGGLPTVKSGLRALSKGNRFHRPQTDPRQLGGTLVIQPNGEIMWRYMSKFAGDHPTLGQIQTAVEQAKRILSSRTGS